MPKLTTLSYITLDGRDEEDFLLYREKVTNYDQDLLQLIFRKLIVHLKDKHGYENGKEMVINFWDPKRNYLTG